MAIQEETFAAPGTSAPRATSAPSQQGGAPTKAWSFFSSNNLGGMSRRPTSEVLTKAHDVIVKQLTDNPIDNRFTIELLKVDNTKSTELRLSSVVATVKINSVDNLIAYHTVLLEGSSDPIPSRTESINGAPVVVRRFASDVYSQTYSQAVRDLVTSMNPGFEVVDCSATVLPSSFNFEDKDAVRAFVQNAILPSVSELAQRAPGYVEINLASLERDCSLQAAVAFNEQTRTDYSGLPVRNDISVTLQAVSTTRQDANELNNQERSLTLAQVGGFIDFVWAPENESVTTYGQYNPAQNRKFAARFVATSLENLQGYSIENQLLALAPALTLGEGTNWYPAFSPRLLNGGLKTSVNPRDIGALNIEANVLDTTGAGGYGAVIDTTAASFTHQELGRFIHMAIRPGLLFSVDVSACGSDTWYNEVLSAAAGGNPGAAHAILEAANVLTNGNFAQIYGNSGCPVLQNDERIMLGYYVGTDGQRHDIREIDHLAVLNYIGTKDPAAAQNWGDTYTREDYPISKRIEYRERMVQEIIGSEVVFTQHAQRVTFTKVFLEAFGKALAATGVVIKSVNPAMQGDYINNRGTAAGWISQAALGTGNLGYFTQGFGGQQPVQHQRFNNSSRWA